MKNRDLELLSTYLDGRLKPNESARVESRVKSDPELSAALEDLRAARDILRKLPQRKAPRNFTLTRKMVGLNPPLPRSYSFFRFATAFASLLLALTFAANIAAPRLTYVGPINGGYGGGQGYGMGGGPSIMQAEPEGMADSVPAEEPAMEAAPAMEAPPVAPAPATGEESAEKMAPLPTATAALSATMSAAEEAMPVLPTPEAPTEKSAGEEMPAPPNQQPVQETAVVPFDWQLALLAIALIGAAATYFLRQFAKQKWR